jgi:DNA-binding response OmpR family regulator
VLLVEDEPIARQSMRLFLKTCGYASIEAPTVECALEVLSTGISAAVIDVHLAGQRSGLEVLDPLRRRPELADIPVLVLTGGILTDEEEALIRQQRAYVFYKPEGCEKIVSFLDRLTGRAASAIGSTKAISTGPDDGVRTEFLAQTQRESWWLQSGLTTGDYGRARQILHRWAGASGMLGYTEISRRTLELQALLDEPGPTTAERLRAGVNEIARLCSELAQAPVESTRELSGVLGGLAGGLAGKRVALVGLDASEATWIAHVLDQAQAFSRVLRPMEPDAGSRVLEPFDLVAVAASFESGEAAWNRAVQGAATSPPVLLIGPIEAVAELAPTFHTTAHDFLITPCGPEELVLRASRLLVIADRGPASAGDTCSAARRRVVVADDDPTITALVRAAFQNYDFECHIARDGGQALDLTRTLQPDALVLDVNMPRFDGFEVLDALKNDPATAGVAVVLLSARQQEADVMRGFALGADDYVVKPFSPVELIARVKRLLRTPAV